MGGKGGSSGKRIGKGGGTGGEGKGARVVEGN